MCKLTRTSSTNVVKSVSISLLYKEFFVTVLFCLIEMSLGMGTSEQMDLGSPTIKRYGTLFSKGEAEKVV